MPITVVQIISNELDPRRGMCACQFLDFKLCQAWDAVYHGWIFKSMISTSQRVNNLCQLMWNTSIIDPVRLFLKITVA